MTWKLVFLDKAIEDLNKLSGNQKIQVTKIIRRVLLNPLPNNEGGYGKPLGKVKNIDLSNCLKIKLKKAGIRVVYKLVKTESQMLVIVIGARRDNEVYDEALKRLAELD